MYVYNNIFFSMAMDGQEAYKVMGNVSLFCTTSTFDLKLETCAIFHYVITYHHISYIMAVT